MENYKNIEPADSWSTGIIVSKSTKSLLVCDKETNRRRSLKLSFLRKKRFDNLSDFFSFLRKSVYGDKDSPILLTQNAFYAFETLYQ